jgi:hypothetical protein
VLKKVSLVLCLFLFVSSQKSHSSGCYSSYGYNRSYYPTNYYPTSYYYKEIPYYKEYPVARYVDVYPVYGQLYFGPKSTATYLKTVAAVNAALAATTSKVETSTTTVSTAAPAPAPAPMPTQVTASDLSRVVSVLESTNKQLQGVTTEITALRRDVEVIKQRLLFVEGKIGGGVAPPGSTRTAAPPSPETDRTPTPSRSTPREEEREKEKMPEALPIFMNKCALCHQEGKELKSKSTDYPKGLVLFTRDGKYATITAEVALKLNEVLKDGSMPPELAMKDGKVKQPTQKEVYVMLMNTRQFKVGTPDKGKGSNPSDARKEE